ncbi:SDR family NAD(P)-dependent oxidoreductase [Cryptosporangium phraense]|uniref:SDR family NAD(P)-dependent oxidoreductase n=1 Tax=Cryptosporangium phraense TaxID=2593070 RepID=A0A545AWD6_9ACTN|nr:SDR family NAD(P)-dependent oxidoreductase [Cryptosporangium phraense]TQS45637.1 SDR family NAD(P)-dependent oxidoreductase [Cryptosporangium phraense]
MTQIALITGANKGIGYETARLLVARGFTVLVAARDEGRGRAAADALGATFVPLDVTDDASIEKAAARVAAEHAHLDLLVNNAGLIGDHHGSPSTTPRAALRQVFETNVFGVVAVTNAFLPLLRASDGARIVNVSSEVGSITAVTDPASPLAALVGIPYPASKTALNMVTAMYAKELPFPVLAANPGYCATDLNGHAGYRTAEQGASVVVALATGETDAETGRVWGDRSLLGGDADGIIPW